jgi:hypothetical protein
LHPDGDMTKYYFLATALPALQIGVPPEIDFQELLTLLKENLTEADYRKTLWLRWVYDIYNIRAFWTGEPLDYWGTLDKNELEEALITGENLPSFISDYLQEYETKEERLKNFTMLFVKFYERMASKNIGFLHWYALFERNLLLTLTAFRARQLGRNLETELQYEDPEDETVAQLLAQKDAKTFEPPVEFEDLKPILEECYTKPMDLQKALYEYQFNKLEEFVGLDPFSIDRILVYFLEYIMVDKWGHLDKEKGIEIVDKIVKEIT